MALVDLIKTSESLRLVAYIDSDGVLTNGWGHTGADVYAGQVITEAQADAWLDSDIASHRAQVLELCPALTGNHLDAITDFCFNEGYSHLAGSTLRKDILADDYEDVPSELRKWIYGNGKILPGLVKRREAEIVLWNTP